MRKYAVLLIIFIFSVVFFLQTPFIFNQKTAAQIAPVVPPAGQTGVQKVQCTCDNPGQAGNGKNGYHCTDGTTASCGHQEQACVSSPNNVISTLTPPGTGTQTSYVGVACQVGQTANGQQAITCTCAGATNGQGKPTSVKCTNNITNVTQTNSCGGAAVCVTGSNLSYSGFSNQSVSGIGCEQSCVCDHSGKAGNGNNGWKCYGSNGKLGSTDAGSCSNREDYCQTDSNATNGVSCVDNTTCTCSSDKTQINCTSAGSGANGSNETQSFTCASGTQCETGGNLSHDVFNQQVAGIDCQPIQLPPPPSPPCELWANGQCTSFDSALGNLSTDPAGFIQTIFALLLSISGGIALLLIIRAGYQLMTSQGKPEQIQNGRDQLIAAIVGLVFLIFSFVFLQLIGFDILHIPGISATGGAQNTNTPTCQAGSCIQSTLCSQQNPGRCNTNGCPAGEACVETQ